MAYVAHIRRNATGEVRTKTFKDVTDRPLIDYMWSGGNYGCDCNRSLFFFRDDEDYEDYPCGTIAFSVRITEGGSLVYQDGSWSTVSTSSS